jgi:hypothetical protein
MRKKEHFQNLECTSFVYSAVLELFRIEKIAVSLQLICADAGITVQKFDPQKTCCNTLSTSSILNFIILNEKLV